MTDLAFRAMEFAMAAHSDHKRKYTGAPYCTHLAEVAGMVAAAATSVISSSVDLQTMIAVAWLHDCVEDVDVLPGVIEAQFSRIVMDGVVWLSDLESGNRAERKAASRSRLAKAPAWVQSIKCADLISNTSSIVQHDPKFAVTYLEEKRLLLAVLTQADPRLHAIATSLASQSI